VYSVGAVIPLVCSCMAFRANVARLGRFGEPRSGLCIGATCDVGPGGDMCVRSRISAPTDTFRFSRDPLGWWGIMSVSSDAPFTVIN
jgi:hypothetical protein